MPASPLKQNLDTPVAVADAGGADLLNVSLEADLVVLTGTVAEGGRLELEKHARPLDRDIPLTPNAADKLALATSPQIFWRMTS